MKSLFFKAFRHLVIAIAVLSYCCSAFAENRSNSVRFVEPVCNINSAGRLCSEMSEMTATIASNQEISQKIQDVVNTEDATHIMVSSFFFGDDFLEQLAQAFARNGFRLTVIGDVESVSTLRDLVTTQNSADVSALLHTIALDIPNRDIPFSWHAKVLLVEKNFGSSFSLVTTSDNFRLVDPAVEDLSIEEVGRQSLNFEGYQFRTLTFEDDQREINRHLCFFETASEIADNESLMRFGDDLEGCLLGFSDEPRSIQSVRSFFLPSERMSFLSRISYEFGRSETIRLSSYNYDSPILLELVETAVRNGTDVRLLTDDDAYCRELTHGDKVWLTRAADAGVSVRLVPTSNIHTNFSRFHLKELIFEAQGNKIAFSGSMNFTCAGHCRNAELMYEFSGFDGEAFSQHFDEVWHSVGVTAKELICG